MAVSTDNGEGKARKAAPAAGSAAKAEHEPRSGSAGEGAAADPKGKAAAKPPAGKSRATPRKAPARKAGAIAKSGGVKPSGGAVATKPSKASRKATKTGPAAKATPVKKAAPAPAKRAPAAPRSGTGAARIHSGVKQVKEITMANNIPDYTASVNEAVSEMQSRSKAAYEKSSEMMTEMSDAAKGNVEAMVESGKIFSSGMQELAKSYVEEAKAAYEQMTADLKEMAAVKSPTDLLQLQGKIMRRNFDTMVAATSKNTEKMMKLSNDSFAPISARLSIAADKMSKVG